MQHYGVCLDEAMEGRFSPVFVASLAAQLPEDCRWKVAEDPDAIWNVDRCLMALVINQMRMSAWSSSDKKKRGRKPKPIGPRWMVEGDTSRRLAAVPMSKERLLAELAKPRR